MLRSPRFLLVTSMFFAASCFNAGGDGGGTTGGSAVTCEEYCDRVAGACTAPFQQYTSPQTCRDLCPYMPEGQFGDITGHSVVCRNHAAVEASENPENFCEAAGPLGGNTCGTPCEVFCDLNLRVCTGTNTVYASAVECQMACAAFPNDVPYSSEVTEGDSLACRMYHLNVAAASPGNAVAHCPHTGPVDLDNPSLPCNPKAGGSTGGSGTGGSGTAGTGGTTGGTAGTAGSTSGGGTGGTAGTAGAAGS